MPASIESSLHDFQKVGHLDRWGSAGIGIVVLLGEMDGGMEVPTWEMVQYRLQDPPVITGEAAPTGNVKGGST
jgi:hypothetical protein